MLNCPFLSTWQLWSWLVSTRIGGMSAGLGREWEVAPRQRNIGFQSVARAIIVTIHKQLLCCKKIPLSSNIRYDLLCLEASFYISWSAIKSILYLLYRNWQARPRQFDLGPTFRGRQTSSGWYIMVMIICNCI